MHERPNNNILDQKDDADNNHNGAGEVNIRKNKISKQLTSLTLIIDLLQCIRESTPITYSATTFDGTICLFRSKASNQIGKFIHSLKHATSSSSPSSQSPTIQLNFTFVIITQTYLILRDKTPWHICISNLSMMSKIPMEYKAIAYTIVSETLTKYGSKRIRESEEEAEENAKTPQTLKSYLEGIKQTEGQRQSNTDEIMMRHLKKHKNEHHKTPTHALLSSSLSSPSSSSSHFPADTQHLLSMRKEDHPQYTHTVHQNTWLTSETWTLA